LQASAGSSAPITRLPAVYATDMFDQVAASYVELHNAIPVCVCALPSAFAIARCPRIGSDGCNPLVADSFSQSVATHVVRTPSTPCRPYRGRTVCPLFYKNCPSRTRYADNRYNIFQSAHTDKPLHEFIVSGTPKPTHNMAKAVNFQFRCDQYWRFLIGRRAPGLITEARGGTYVLVCNAARRSCGGYF